MVVIVITIFVGDRDKNGTPNFLPLIAVPIAYVLMAIIGIINQCIVKNKYKNRALMISNKVFNQNQKLKGREFRWTKGGALGSWLTLELDFISNQAQLNLAGGFNPQMGMMGGGYNQPTSMMGGGYNQPTSMLGGGYNNPIGKIGRASCRERV